MHCYLHFTVPTPMLSIARHPDSNVTLRHGDSLNLTCNIWLGTAVAVNDVQVIGMLSGQGIQRPSGAIMDISGRMYQIKETIESLEAEKSAEYTCNVTVKPRSAAMHVVSSKKGCIKLSITVGKVCIECSLRMAVSDA